MMTIKVCKQKTEDIVVNLAKGLYYLFMFSCIAFLPIGIYAIVNDIGLDSQGDSIGWLGIFVGVCGLFVLLFLTPWVMEEPNLISKLNSKYKIFEWNRDC